MPSTHTRHIGRLSMAGAEKPVSHSHLQTRLPVSSPAAFPLVSRHFRLPSQPLLRELCWPFYLALRQSDWTSCGRTGSDWTGTGTGPANSAPFQPLYKVYTMSRPAGKESKQRPSSQHFWLHHDTSPTRALTLTGVRQNGHGGMGTAGCQELLACPKRDHVATSDATRG